MQIMIKWSNVIQVQHLAVVAVFSSGQQQKNAVNTNFCRHFSLPECKPIIQQPKLHD